MPLPPAPPVRRDPRFLAWLALLTVLAWALREHFVLTMRVDNPFRGDVRQYLQAAWNLVHHGVLATVPPGPATPPPDAYRPPGYPWLLAACMRLRPEGWYGLAMQLQVALGAATVALTGCIGRRWLPRAGALAAAALLAFWPHHIAASGALLSEVLFGFLLSVALLLAARDRPGAAGLAFGAAALVNPLVALFPPALALAHPGWRARRRWRFLLLATLPVALMLARDATVPATPDRPGRLAANLVQGAWPLYHAAQNDAHLGMPIPIAIMRQIDDDTRLMSTHPGAGLSRIAGRIADDPGAYARWYLLRKPWLLWDWDIRVGYGGPYTLAVRASALERPPLRAITEGYRLATPLLALLALAGVLAVAAGAVRGHATTPPAAIAVALLAVYLTAVHAVLQAEPRYANAYRGLEALLAVAGLVAAWRLARGRGRTPGPAEPEASGAQPG